MTAMDVRDAFIKAGDAYNDYLERHKDQYLRYKEDFMRYSAIRDPYEKRNLIKALTLGDRNHKFFLTVVRLLSEYNYWNEQAARYRVDDAVVLAIPSDLPNWLQELQGSDHHLHPNYEPVKGKVFLPGH